MWGSLSPGGLIALAVACLAVPGLFVGLRFRARWKDRIQYGADDYTVLAAFVTFIAIWVIPIIIGVVDGGLASHLPIDPVTGMQALPNEVFTNTHFTYLTFGAIPPGLARLSILLFYNRIFVGRTFDIVNRTLILYTILWIVIMTLLYLFKCGAPSTVIFDPTAKCIDLWMYLKVLGITSALSDLFILLVPWPFIYNLHMRRAQKLSVGAIFLLGNLALAMSVVRCIVLFEVDALILAGDTDFTYDDGVNSVWALLETTIIILCACLPTLGRYLWRGFSGNVRTWTSSVKSRMRPNNPNSKSYERSPSSGGNSMQIYPKQDSTASCEGPQSQTTTTHTPGQIEVVHEFEVVREDCSRV